MARIAYVPAIDGLRTLAIAPVILFHLGLSWMPGGFAGVDVFFVISGYLITSIILDECHSGSFSFSHFWQRRVRRIMPALTAMVIVTSIAGYCLRYGRDIEDLGLQGMAAIASLANVCLWLQAGDYWGSAAEHSLLLHTWSLSVEEQFYLFFPLFLFALVRYCPQRVMVVVAMLALSSLGLYLARADSHPADTFYLLPTRIWELAAGGLLAIWFFKHPVWRPARTHAVLAVVGMLAMLLSYVLLGQDAVAQGALLLPIIGTVLVILDQHNRESWLNRWLASAPMVTVGQLSYSLYLWHWPVIVLAKEQLPGLPAWQLNTAVLLLTAVLAWLSYRLLEKPTRHHPQALRWIGVAVLLSLLLSAYLYQVGKYHDVSPYNSTVWRGPLYDVAPVPVEASARWQKEGLQVMQPAQSAGDAYAGEGIVQRHGAGDPAIVVLGDSLALAIAGQMDDIAKAQGLTVAFYSARGTPVFPAANPAAATATLFFTANQKQAFDGARQEQLLRWKPAVVVIAGRWAALADKNEQTNRQEQEAARQLIAQLNANGTRVILLEQPPELAMGDVTLVQYLAHKKILPDDGVHYLPEKTTPAYDAGQAFIRTLAAGCGHCIYVPTRDLFTTGDGQVQVLAGRDVLYRDDDHLSEAGAQRVRPRLEAAISAAMAH